MRDKIKSIKLEDADSLKTAISELSTTQTETDSAGYDLDDMESIHFEPRKKRSDSLCTYDVAKRWSTGKVEQTEVEMLREWRRLSVCSLQTM